MECPICGNASRLDQPHPEVVLFCCSQCGHRFSQMKPDVPAESYNAEYYEKTHRNWFAHPDLTLFEQIARRIDREPEPRSLIDVGCGNGNFLHFLAGRKCHSKVALTGIDLSANESNSSIKFIQGDLLSTNIDRQFSVVVSLATIEHIADVRGFTRRLANLAKPNGLAIVMTVNDNSLLYKTARLLRCTGISIAFDRLYGRHHLHHFSKASLAQLLENEGLQPEETVLHNAPLAAIDIPVAGLAGMFMRLGMVGINSVAQVSGHSYLQTVICRKEK
jgi:2-polyprenyl-3-methyl-5-hydroxy-6-metoxy-1,4-benzoquinol methylase